ncbi:MAG: 2-oxo acid dehydrogenase subunit E2, partial [Ignavibacteriaceae bacterium]|nr:2-oxo acid dehydrogenase subunit E2 [Ignavibacteriaceae bacterium]
YKKTGDKIEKDEILFEISTDKVDTEVPSPEAGTVAEILVAEQETVEVGTVVAKIATEGNYVHIQEPVVAKTVSEEKPKAPAQMHNNFDKGSADDFNIVKEKSDKFYSPLVMSIAKKENITFDELESIKGTGQGGRVTKKDILSYHENRAAKKVESTPKVPDKITASARVKDPVIISSASGDVEKIEMDNIRQKIMQHMVRSRDTSVHVSAMIEVDMSKVHNFIKDNKDEYLKREGVKLTYMAFIAHAAVKALKEYSLLNSTIDGTTILKKKYINLGIAVAIQPTGLIVPNIKNAGEKNILGLGRAISDVAVRARNKKLTPDDISNGTFTITNYGVFGTIFGTPIINQPEVAILGVGVVEKKPVVVEVEGMDMIAIRPIMSLTLSHDHRLIDGMLGGIFLKFIKDTLENFEAGSV